MEPVLNLSAYREGRSGSGAARCSCGSEWFTLRGGASTPDVAAHGALTFAADGRVTGYAGTPICVECGTPLDF